MEILNLMSGIYRKLAGKRQYIDIIYRLFAQALKEGRGRWNEGIGE
jgi:hypothetical protein